MAYADIFALHISSPLILGIKCITVYLPRQENSSSLAAGFRFDDEGLCLAWQSIVMILF